MVATKKPKARRASADSMEAAAAMLGCSVPDLKRAKAGGCKAFRHGRVDIETLREWLAENKPEPSDIDKEALECRRLLAQCEKLEYQLAIEQRQYIAASEVQSDMIRIGHGVKSSLQRLRADAPTWAGMEAHQIEKRVDALLDQVSADLHDATSRLYQ